MWMLSILDMMNDQEIDSQQRSLVNVNGTVVVRVDINKAQLAWEVPNEFTVKDLNDLLELKIQKRGKLICKDQQLDSRLMLEFVRLYVYREMEVFTIELV